MTRPSLFGDAASPVITAPPAPYIERPSPYRPPSPAELAARVLPWVKTSAESAVRAWNRRVDAPPSGMVG